MTLHFIPPSYAHGRIEAHAGKVCVGAIYPPIGPRKSRTPWEWRLWVNGKTWASQGSEKTERDAKLRLQLAWDEFLHRANLIERTAND